MTPKSFWHDLYKLFGNILHGIFVSSPLFINLTHLYYHKLKDIYFIFWIIIQYYYIYFVIQTVLSLAIGNAFNQFLCLFNITTSLWRVGVCGCVYVRVCMCMCVCCILPYFLELENTSDWSCIFSAPILKSASYLRSSGFFHWRLVSEIKIWEQSVVIATGVSLLLGHLIWQNRKTYVYIVTWAYTYL